MKIAICQLDIQYEAKEKNLARANDFIEEAATQNAHIILFPEMSFTGFSMQTEMTGEEDDYTVNAMRELAKKNSIAIGFGWVCGTKMAQNHYTVVGPDGSILGDYAKIHPFSYSGEDEHFVGGDKVVTFAYEGITFGMSICYDMRFPELYQRLSKDATILLVPANWPAKRAKHWKALLTARAIENQSYMIGINCAGEQDGLLYSGDSQVVNPDGNVIADAGAGEKLVICEVIDDVAEYRKNFPTKRDRREDLYRTFY